MDEESVDFSEAGKTIEIRPGQYEVVEYALRDRWGTKFYVTLERLQHIARKRAARKQWSLGDYGEQIPMVLADPDVVILDPQYPDGHTRLYYRFCEGLADEEGREAWLAVAVEVREDVNFVWTIHPRRKGQIKTVPGVETVSIYRKEE